MVFSEKNLSNVDESVKKEVDDLTSQVKTSHTKKYWYVIQVYSGHETRVKEQIEERIKLSSLQSFFGQILIPTEEVIEVKSGRKHKSKRKFFPGYILINMCITSSSGELIRRIPKVTGFVGGTSGNPLPISSKEADNILGVIKKGNSSSPKPRVTFQVGQVVRVLEGPFSDFTGTVENINYEKSLLQIAVSIFGRATPVELEFFQVEKDN